MEIEIVSMLDAIYIASEQWSVSKTILLAIKQFLDAEKELWYKFALLKPCIVNTPLVVNVNNAIQVYKGHGDGDTKWKGWAWNTFNKLVML